MQGMTYKELKEEHGLSNKRIQKLDRDAQKVLGNALMMIDRCLRSEEECGTKVSTCLVYVSMAMEMLENNFLEAVSENLKKEELN
ncbi:MAG: hypothetical protein CMK74_15745 [Pseudomonadales bacterium]|nr:hypothetical protein [Pseudomonadales bacterium]|tara:strand:+ start:582 stop:836 length:255 start_codon:yes stop_codon:yes gene_type:complete